MRIQTLRQFVVLCDTAQPDEIYNMFEHECADDVRDLVYSMADESSPEPFRSAMENMGFVI